MTQTLILLFHPDYDNSRANRALAEAAGSRPGTTIVDMQALYPDGRIDADVEVARPLAAERIILQFPVQWYSTPPLLKAAIGVVNMSDEAGKDAKLLAVPHDKLTVLYKHVKEPSDLPELLIKQIQHFFENYKDLEVGKWVKVENLEGSEAARAAIMKAAAAYKG